MRRHIGVAIFRFAADAGALLLTLAGAGGFLHRLPVTEVVAGRVDIIRLVVVAAAFAGVGGVTHFRAGRLGDNSGIAVAGARKGFGVAVAALGAGIGFVAVLGAGRIHRISQRVGMSAQLIGDLDKRRCLLNRALIVAMGGADGNLGLDIVFSDREGQQRQRLASQKLSAGGIGQNQLTLLLANRGEAGGARADIGQLFRIIGDLQQAVGYSHVLRDSNRDRAILALVGLHLCMNRVERATNCQSVIRKLVVIDKAGIGANQCVGLHGLNLAMDQLRSDRIHRQLLGQVEGCDGRSATDRADLAAGQLHLQHVHFDVNVVELSRILIVGNNQSIVDAIVDIDHAHLRCACKGEANVANLLKVAGIVHCICAIIVAHDRGNNDNVIEIAAVGQRSIGVGVQLLAILHDLRHAHEGQGAQCTLEFTGQIPAGDIRDRAKLVDIPHDELLAQVNIDRHIARNECCGIAIVIGITQLQSRHGGHVGGGLLIADDATGGNVIIILRLDHIQIGNNCPVVPVDVCLVVAAVDHIVMHTAAIEIGMVIVHDGGVLDIVRLDACPVAAVLAQLELGIDSQVDLHDVLNMDGNLLADRLTSRIGVHSLHNDRRIAGRHRGHTALGVHRQDALVAGGVGHTTLEACGNRIGRDLLHIANIGADALRAHAQGQVRGLLILIQRVGGPDSVANIAQLQRCAALRLDGIEARGGVILLIGHQRQAAGLGIIDRGSEGILQLTRAAELDGRNSSLADGEVVAFLLGGVSRQNDFIDAAGLGNRIVGIGRAIGVGLAVRLDRNIGQTGKGHRHQAVAAQDSSVRVLNDGRLVGVDNGNTAAAVAGSDDAVKEAVHFLCCCGIRPGIVAADVADIILGKHIRIHGIDAARIVDIDHILEQNCTIGRAAIVIADGLPALGAAAVESDPEGGTIHIHQEGIEIHRRQVVNRNLNRLLEVRLGIGRHGDGRSTGSQGRDGTILHRRNLRRRGFPAQALILKRPGGEGGAHRRRGAGHHLQLADVDLQRFCLRCLLNQANLAANEVGSRHFQLEISRSSGQAAKRPGGAADVDPAKGVNVISAPAIIEEAVVLMIPRQSLALVGVAADIAGAKGFQIGNRAIDNHIQREAECLNTELILRAAVGNHIEGSLVVNRQTTQPVAGLISGVEDGNREFAGQFAGIEVNRINGVVCAQRIELLVRVAQRHILNAIGTDIRQFHHGAAVAMRRDTEAAIGGHHVGVAVNILRSNDACATGACVRIGCAVDIHADPGALRLRIGKEAAALAAGGCAGVAALTGLLQIQGHFIGRLIAGIVAQNQQAGLTGLNAAQIHGHHLQIAGIVKNLRNRRRVGRRSVQASQAHGRDILIILAVDHKLIRVVCTTGNRNQLRCRVIHDHLSGQGCTLAQHAGIQQLDHTVDGNRLTQHIILRHGNQRHREAVVLLQAKRLDRETQADAGVGVAPCAAIGIIISAIDIGRAGLVEHLAGCVADQGHISRRISKQRCAVALQHILAAHGRSALGIAVLKCIGVADLIVGGTRAVDYQLVGLRSADIGRSAVAIELLGVADTKHGGIGPGAIETENRDGVRGIAGSAFGIRLRIDQHEALDIGAVGIGLVQRSHLLTGELCLHRNGDAAARSDGEGAGLQTGQQQMRVIGIDGAAAVHIRNFSDFRKKARCVVQNDLRISRIRQAIVIQVAIDAHDLVCIGHAINLIAEICAQRGGVLIEIGAVAVLREQLGGQTVGRIRLGKVVNREAEGIQTGAVGIVAQLCLDLAIHPGGGCILAHEDIAPGSNGIVELHKTGTLLEDGVIICLLLQQRQRGGHHKALRKLTDGAARLLDQPVVADILRHHCGRASHLRRRHGGTGHGLIALAAGNCAVDRVDVAAGRCDLRLHFQRVRNTPGGEIGHRLIGRLLISAIFRHGGTVHGGNAQGVGVCTGAAAGVEADILHIESLLADVFIPAIGVACGDGDNRIRFLQASQKLLIGRVEGEAGGAGAQRQVDRVAAQNDGVLNGCHIVRVVGAAVDAEDLHGDDLRIRRDTGHTDRVHCLDEGAVALRNVGIRRSDTLNVRAVLAL